MSNWIGTNSKKKTKKQLDKSVICNASNCQWQERREPVSLMWIRNATDVDIKRSVSLRRRRKKNADSRLWNRLPVFTMQTISPLLPPLSHFWRRIVCLPFHPSCNKIQTKKKKLRVVFIEEFIAGDLIYYQVCALSLPAGGCVRYTEQRQEILAPVNATFLHITSGFHNQRP